VPGGRLIFALTAAFAAGPVFGAPSSLPSSPNAVTQAITISIQQESQTALAALPSLENQSHSLPGIIPAPVQAADSASHALATDEQSGTTLGLPSLPALSPGEPADMVRHLRDSLTSELYDSFQLFLYVSKATRGPWAQHMFVLQKQPTGALVLLDDWPVSTGRERDEFNRAGVELPSFTPSGYYELDPDRAYTDYRSFQWGEPMPYAMFFRWTKDGHETGLAIHAATDDEVALLGTRASAGCIRLPPKAAHDLYGLIQTQYRGLMPIFETDLHSGTMRNDGILLQNPDTSFQLVDGYKVLVFIDDYGGDRTVSSLP